MTPQVSLLMPVKNAAAFLPKTLQSLQQQSLTRWELLAVNDHSEDDSEAILEAAAQKDARIQVLKNAGQGIIPALEKAWQASTGLYITRLDADDLLPPLRLAQMVSALSRSPAQTVVTGLVQYFGEAPVSPGYRQYEQWLNENLQHANPWRQVYRECIVASPNWMITQADLKSLGGFKNLHYPEDYDLVFQWYARGFKLKCLPQITLHWREHTQRTSRHSAHYQQEAFFKLKLQRFIELEQPKNLVLWGRGIKAKLSARLLQKQQQTFRWMDLKPSQAQWTEPAIEQYQALASVPSPKVLVAVYPAKGQRASLENYLNELGLKEGRDWWYL